MATLLQVNSSPFNNEASFSRQLTAEFVQHWTRSHPGGPVVTRDVTASGLTPVDAEWIVASHTPAADRSARQRQVLALSQTLIDELKAADEYVFGVAMHNFSIPGALKLWIDQISRAGETFSYANGKPGGLLSGKKATFLVASGGVYDLGTPFASMNFVEPYLRSVFAFLGVTDVTFVNASGTARARFGTDRQAILEPAVRSIQARFMGSAEASAGLY